MPDDEIRMVNWSGVAMLCAILLAVLLFVGAAVVGMYFAVQWLGLQAAIAWAAFVGLALLLVRIEQQRKHEQERVLADRKREQYFELLELLRKCFYSKDPVQATRRQKQDLDKWSLRLALIGSDQVLDAWHDFCRVSLDEFEDDDEEEHDESDGDEEEEEEEDDLFAAQVRLLLALRRDCGQPTTHLTRWRLADILDTGQ